MTLPRARAVNARAKRPRYCRAMAQPAHAWPKQLDGKTKKLLKEVEVAATEAKRFADNAIRWNSDELDPMFFLTPS